MPKRGVKLSGRSGSKFGGKDADTGSEKRKAAQLKGKAVAGKGKGEYSVSDLVAKAEHFMDSLEPALALKFYLRALEQEPDNPLLLDAAGEIYIEHIGDVEKAREMFAHSIRVAPDSSASKWMYSAQCEDDPKAAVAAFTRGIRILSAQRESLPPPTSAVDEGEEDPSTLLNTVNTQLISAYCSVAELYMTDLCDEPDAEAKCEECVAGAMAADPEAVESLYLLGNVRLCQNRKEEAVAAVSKLSVSLFRRSAGISAAAAASGGAGHDSDEDDDEDEDDEESLPVYAMRVSIAKLMLEVGQPVPAALILERLLLEDDTVPEVWFLIAAAYRDSSRLATARQYLTTLEENMCKAIEAGQDTDGSLQAIVEEAQAAISSIPPDAVDADTVDE